MLRVCNRLSPVIINDVTGVTGFARDMHMRAAQVQGSLFKVQN
jgi:hypothetical protein